MKPIKLLATAALALAALLGLRAEAGEVLLAGAAKVEITPDVSRWKVNSIGYFSQKVMTSVNDPMFCAALVVSDGAEEAAIVTCDLMGTPPVLRQKVLAGLAGAGLDDHNLLIAGSHTHSGPGNMMPNLIARIGFGGYNEELTQWTADRIIAAIEQARAGLRPATVRVSATKLPDVTRNRRDPAGAYNYDTRRFTTAYDPQDPANLTDPTLTLVRIDGRDGSPIALLFHFAMHGTVLGPEVTYLSADWAGAAQRLIAEQAPGYAVMYMNGAQGDQAPAMIDGDPMTDLEYLDFIGAKVAAGVASIMDQGETIAATPVRAIMVHREVPAGNNLMGKKVPRALVAHYFSQMPLQALRVGDLAFMALPVEAVCSVGQTMKAGAKGFGVKYPLVAGLANDHLLYTAAPDDFPQGGYEVDMTALGQIEAGVLIGEQMMLARKLYLP